MQVTFVPVCEECPMVPEASYVLSVLASTVRWFISLQSEMGHTHREEKIHILPFVYQKYHHKQTNKHKTKQ